MTIEVRGPEHLLEDLRLFVAAQFTKLGYSQGPKVSTTDSGSISFMKGDYIVVICIQKEENDSLMYVESDQNIPELSDIWDKAIIDYGKNFLSRLRSFSMDKKKVDQALKA